MTAPAKSRRLRLRDDSGQMLVFFAVIISAFFVLMLVVVDGTHAFDQRRNLQNAADAAALAAAWDLAQGDLSSMGPDAAEYSNANNGPSEVGSSLPKCDDRNGTTTNCYLTPYIDETGPRPTEVEVRLHIGCIPTFFGKIANYVTGSSSFECISESANAVAEGWSADPQVPYKFVALMSEGEKQTLRVDTGGRLTVDNGIYVNARVAEWNPNTCQGALATDPGSAFESCGPVSAPRVSVVGGWSGTPYSLTVGSGPGACSSGHYDATSPPPSDCALNVGAPTFVDPLRSLGGSELLGPPAKDSCELCTTVNVLRIRRDSMTGQVSVWVDSMPPVAVGMKIALRNITLDGSPDHTFDENDYEVQSSGTDSTGNWILLAPPFGQGAVSNVPPLIPVTGLSLEQGTATLSTGPNQHGISGGDPIAVKNVDPNMDGSFTADSPLAPTGTSLTYQDPKTTTYSISSESLTTGTDGTHTATITVSPPPSQDAGVDMITVDAGDSVFGSGDEFVVQGTTTSPTGTITYNTPANLSPMGVAMTSASGVGNPCGVPSCVTVQLANNPFSANDTVTINSPDAPFTGTQTVPVPAANSFSYVAPPVVFDQGYSVTGSTATLKTSGTIAQNVDRANITAAPPGATYLTLGGGVARVTVSPDGHSISYPLPNGTHDGQSGSGSSTVILRRALSFAPSWNLTANTIAARAPSGGSRTATALAYVPPSTCGPPLTCGTVSKDQPVTLNPTGLLSLALRGSEYLPSPRYVNSPTTLHAGTYYGGICIGVSDTLPCGPRQCDATPGPGPTVTLDPRDPADPTKDGIFVMASGGFYVCGNANILGPNGQPAHIMIYNTDEQANQGYIGRVEINTTGSVELEQYEGTARPEYDGITIYQDRNDVNDLQGSDTGIHPFVDSTDDYSGVKVADPSGSMNATTTRLNYTGGQIRAGDVIKIGDEMMLVTALPGARKANVVRAFLDRPGYPAPAETHGNGSLIHYVSFDGDTCAQKSPVTASENWDVALLGMKSIGSIQGTIYVPGPRAMFGVGPGVDGTAELAVYSSCISINGNDTFNVHPTDVPTEFHSSLVG